MIDVTKTITINGSSVTIKAALIALLPSLTQILSEWNGKGLLSYIKYLVGNTTTQF